MARHGTAFCEGISVTAAARTLALLPHYRPLKGALGWSVGRTRVVRLVKHIVAADDVVADIKIAAIDLHALGLA